MTKRWERACTSTEAYQRRKMTVAGGMEGASGGKLVVPAPDAGLSGANKFEVRKECDVSVKGCAEVIEGVALLDGSVQRGVEGQE